MRGPEGIAHARPVADVTPLSRQALLLTSLEGFSSEDTAYLIDASRRMSTAWSPKRLAIAVRGKCCQFDVRADVLVVEGRLAVC